MTRNRVTTWVVAAIAVALVPVGWLAFEQGAEPDQGRFTVALLTGVHLALVVTAVAGIRRRPGDPMPRRLLVGACVFTVSHFRYVESDWLAAAGAFVWYAGPLAWMGLLAIPASSRLRVRTARWTAAFVTVAAAAVAVSGPAGQREPSVLRAASWAYWNDRRDAWTRQPNPLLVHAADGAVMICWIAWSALVVALATGLVRAIADWRWRIGLVVAVAATVLAARPQRIVDDSYLLARPVGDLLSGLPAMAVGSVAAWSVWNELVVPRLVRPAALVLQLDPGATVEAIGRRLAEVLGDPSTRVAFPRNSRWVDDHGTALDGRPDRRLVVLTREGEPVAALELDATTAVAPDLLHEAITSLSASLDARRLAALAGAAAAEERAAAARLLEVERQAVAEIAGAVASGPDRTLADVDALLDRRPLPLDDIQQRLRHALGQVRAIAHRSTLPDTATEVPT